MPGARAHCKPVLHIEAERLVKRVEVEHPVQHLAKGSANIRATGGHARYAGLELCVRVCHMTPIRLAMAHGVNATARRPKV